MLSTEELKKIDIGDINELQIEGNTYYTIKNLNDGDYIAINNTGEVFIITHTPFEVKKLYSSIRFFCIRRYNFYSVQEISCYFYLS